MKEMPEWCEGEEWCAVTVTSSIIGKKWHPVIVYRLLQSPKGFNQLKREIEGVTSKVLSESLKDLDAKGIVEREVISENPDQVRYSLTETGESLEPVIVEMRDWANTYVSGGPEQGSNSTTDVVQT